MSIKKRGPHPKYMGGIQRMPKQQKRSHLINAHNYTPSHYLAVKQSINFKDIEPLDQHVPTVILTDLGKHSFITTS